LVLDRLEATAFERRVLGMLYRAFDRTLPVGVGDAANVGDDAKVREGCGIPWALKITVAPSGTSLSSSTNTAPIVRSLSTTYLLCTTS
jgi:hypothetical protein